MAWIIDPNFGSTHFARDAIAPFPTGGGNRVLVNGAGVVYNNAQSFTDGSLSFDFVTRPPSFTGSKGFGVGMRDASGNIYFCELWHSSNFLVAGDQIATQISKYRQSTDTFVALVTFASYISTPLIDQLLQVEFRKNISSISVLVNGTVSSSVSDSEFLGPFNICVVGALGYSTAFSVSVLKEIDNLRLGTI